MSEEEIHFLRAANSRLEHETHLLRLCRQRAEKELTNAREQLEDEKRLVRKLRKERAEELKELRHDDAKKYEYAISDLRTRLQVELDQSLEQQKLQMERNFRSELMKLVHAKDSQLHRLFNHTQRLKREADKKRTDEIQRVSGSYHVQLEKLKQGFQKQLIQLLLELKNKERHIETLRKSLSCSYGTKCLCSSSSDQGESFIVSSSIDSTNPTTTTTSFLYSYKDSQRRYHHCCRPTSRRKSYQESRADQEPYKSLSSAAGKRRHEWKAKSMKEIGDRQPVDTQQFFYHNHYGGSALETLPEAESEEEEGSETLGAAEHENLSVTSCSSQASDENFPLIQDSSGSTLEIREGGAIIRCGSSPHDQRSKILSLELTIRQLRDELRECKDQNELLEFRLLEIEEVGSNSIPRTTGNETRNKCGKANRARNLMATTGAEVTLYHGTEVPTEVTIRGDYDSSSNSHASVAESRSSCSDCSDSLSLQESGIFDSHSVNGDSYVAAGHGPGGMVVHLSHHHHHAPHVGNREDISRELANLTAQIENLVIRFTEGSIGTSTDGNSATDGSEDGSTSGPFLQEPHSGSIDSNNLPRSCATTTGHSHNSGRISNKGKRGQDLGTELKLCRQKMQEFEIRVSHLPDTNYINSLEDKVSLLIQENQRLEEERAEMEEAENDSRHQCQRLEQKIQQLRQKKGLLQRELGSEKLCIEQMRIRILQLQEREEELSSQVVRVEAALQSYEQQNFELEESCIEMKCSVQYVVNCIPVLIVWYLWSLLNRFQEEAVFNKKDRPRPLSCLGFAKRDEREQKKLPSPPLPPRNHPVRPPPLPRKHKLLAGERMMSLEPRLKKLRGEMEEDEKASPQPFSSFPSVQQQSSETQTCEDFFQTIIKEIVQVQQQQWEKVEGALRKRIEMLECDIELGHNDAENQQRQLVSIYEAKLVDQEKALNASKLCLDERQVLQEKWDSLILELEAFVSTCVAPDSDSMHRVSKDDDNKTCSRNDDTNKPTNNPPTARRSAECERIKGGSLVANRIRSLFPGEWKGCKNSAVADEVDFPSQGTVETTSKKAGVAADSTTERFTNKLVLRLEEAFKEQVAKFEEREKELVDEIEELRRELKEKLAFSALPHGSSSSTTEPSVYCDDNSQIVYLSEENKRLQIILSDQEAVLSRVKELEEENERLSVELAANGTLRRRLEDAHSVETSLRNRIEELEQSEIYVKETVEQLERQERKCLERISQLREEIQFLRNKCCQLQDDLDSKITREAKYKNEIQTLANKVTTCMQELEEKENLLENNAEVSQSQLSKLRAQLNDVQKQLADAECTNGMLREEVLYLERTVQEAIERSSSTEKLVATLTSELQSREGTMDTLMTELEIHRSGSHKHNHPYESQLPNDLDIFAQNEGGLFGVDRDIKDIATQIKSCSRESCRSSSKKLTEVSEQLNTLTLMLSGSPDMDRINRDSRGVPELLSRCESDECLTRSLVVGNGSQDLRKIVPKTKGFSLALSSTSSPSTSSSACSSPSPPPPPLPTSPPPQQLEEFPTAVIVPMTTEEKITQLEIELEDRDSEIVALRDRTSELSLKICQLEGMFKSRQQELRDSHLAECSWYSARCGQKNALVRILARRIAQLSATDNHGIFLISILNELKQLDRCTSYPRGYAINKINITNVVCDGSSDENLQHDPDLDFTTESLSLFLQVERKRMMKLMDAACEDAVDGDSAVVTSQLYGKEDFYGAAGTDMEGKIQEDLEFRICRRVAQDALLVSWFIPHKYSTEKVDGYEISVNGKVFLRIRKPNRFKAVLYGLDLSEPLNLSLRCTGSSQYRESTITYIA